MRCRPRPLRWFGKQRRNNVDPEKIIRALVRSSAAVASVAILVISASQTAQAQDAAKVLKAMSDYTGEQKSISAAFDSDIEIITPELQKIQFTSSGQLKLSRPDKLRIRRTGGYADVELVYDGKMLSLYGNNAKSYVQADAPGTIDKLIDTLQAKAGAAMPGTDLLLSKSYDELMANAIEASTSARASLMVSSANIWRFAAPTRTGRSGSRPARVRCRANTSSPARRLPARRNTPCASRTGRRMRSQMRTPLSSRLRPTRRKVALDPRRDDGVRRTSPRHTRRSQKMTISPQRISCLSLPPLFSPAGCSGTARPTSMTDSSRRPKLVSDVP